MHFEQGKKSISRPAVRIAIIGIALGLSVMIVSVAVVIGFKNEIRSKTIGFGGHIQITNFDNNNTYAMNPIQVHQSLLRRIKSIEGVRQVQRFATKPGIIKTDNQFQGIVVKGVDKGFDWSFFKSNLLEGSVLNFDSNDLGNNVIISRYLAEILNLKLGDTFLTYFIQDQVRVRKFKITGIYATNFIEYDRLFVLVDIRHVQALNNWESNSFSGLEILIDDFDQIDQVGDNVYESTANIFSKQGNAYITQTIKQLNPQVFSWLNLLDTNVWVILMLMLSVAGFNMISGLMILILERTNMIGVLKALGANDLSIRKMFLFHSFFLIGKGMIWGNIIGLILCAIQYYWHLIPLDPQAYYVSTVPICFDWLNIILLNLGTLLASLLMMIAPTYLITKISPAKIIRYE